MALAYSSPVISACNFGRDVPCLKATKNTTSLKPVNKSIPQTTKVEAVVRRSGDYQPCIWDHDFFQSLTTDFTGEGCNARSSELKQDVKLIIKNAVDPLNQLELIDQLQRLGLRYHFEGEIKRTLEQIYNNNHTTDNDKWEKNLHATALKFRLLREHGYHMSSEVFIGFTENERFKESLGEDVKGMLSLYQASYYSIEGESLMEEAYSFTSKRLKECVKSIDDSDLVMRISHALELPLQWRIPRLDAKWYIDVYETSGDMIPEVLNFAKFDFNIVQGLNQDELKDVSRWWKGTNLGQKLDFIRDRLPTSFLWAVGITCNHQHGYFRRQITKVIQFITLLDDVYDVYGTLDELELFTAVIERWDINAITELPHYMKICFLSLNNLVTEIAYDVLNEQKVNVLPQLRKAWIDIMLGVSELVARAHMIDLMKKKWEKIIKCLFSGDIPLDQSSVVIILNMVRMSHCTYNSGADGYGVEDGLSKKRMFSLFTEPIISLFCRKLQLAKLREPSHIITKKSA